MSIDYNAIFNPAVLTSNILGLAIYEWGLLAIVILASVIISGLISKKLNHMIIRVVQKLNQNNIDPVDLHHVSLTSPLNVILIGWVLYFGLYIINIAADTMTILAISKLLSYLGSIFLGWRLVDIIQVILLKRAEKTAEKMDDLLAPLYMSKFKDSYWHHWNIIHRRNIKAPHHQPGCRAWHWWYCTCNGRKRYGSQRVWLINRTG